MSGTDGMTGMGGMNRMDGMRRIISSSCMSFKWLTPVPLDMINMCLVWMEWTEWMEWAVWGVWTVWIELSISKANTQPYWYERLTGM